MRYASCILAMNVLLWCGCAAPPPPPRDLTGSLSGYLAVPSEVIAKLPGKIRRLPVTKSMRGIDFLRELDLEDYMGNIDLSSRGGVVTMLLDRDFKLTILLEPGSLYFAKTDTENIINSRTPQADLIRLKFRSPVPRVQGCFLTKEQEVIIDRRLNEPYQRKKQR